MGGSSTEVHMANDTVALNAAIPSTTAIFTGSSKVNAFCIQPDCDCMIQFTKTDGTALSGPIHIPQYEIYSQGCQGDGFLLSTSGLKIVVTGNASGNIRGFFTTHNS
jgi:hypothetical protein